MELSRLNLMYELHVDDDIRTEALTQFTDHAVKEIKSTAGWNADVYVNIEPEARDKRLYSVSMAVSGLSDPIFVRKDSRNLLAALRKVRKAVVRQIHRLKERPFTLRRKQALKIQHAP